MESNEKKVEAVLFAVGKEITAERVAVLCQLEVSQVEGILAHLVAEYAQQDHSLQLVRKELGWKLTVKDEFVPLVSSLVSSTELEKPLMETLAVIAWKYPIVQSEIIKLRGSSSYEHMARLEELGFVEKEKHGRTFKVKLTRKFFEYFDLPSEEAKQAFLKQVPQEVLQEAEEVSKEADEVERLVEMEKNEQGARDEIKGAMEGMKKE
ncbi:TPA: SMC-Scp complex subunit ScpB [Candidatus Woesearchaeota archaeon]|nr:SMC-Scp complex subunit ScpB [Candidatus Woesearchaeota archaeon]